MNILKEKKSLKIRLGNFKKFLIKKRSPQKKEGVAKTKGCAKY